jgi:hypothetical protein
MHLIEDKAIKIAIKEFQITNPDHQARVVEARTHLILLQPKSFLSDRLDRVLGARLISRYGPRRRRWIGYPKYRTAEPTRYDRP